MTSAKSAGRVDARGAAKGNTAMLWKIGIGAAVGLVLGYLAGRRVKCSTGACLLTMSPWIGAISGALLGGIAAFAFASAGEAEARRGSSTASTGPTAPGEVRHVESAEQFDRLLAGGRPVLADFYADWCAPCRILAPVIASLAGEYADELRVVKVDVDKLGALARRYKVRAIPTVYLFADGREVAHWVGVKHKAQYAERIESLLKERRKDKTMTQPKKVTMKGNPVELVGSVPEVGQAAPAFIAVGNDLSEVSLSDFAGKTVVIAAVPSLDTKVCDMEARRFNAEAAKLGDVSILVMSMDLPFAQKRWCGSAGADAVQTLSDHRDASFGRAYGVLIEGLRLLARSVFIVDAGGKIRYVQLVDELMNEPNYDEALAALGDVRT